MTPAELDDYVEQWLLEKFGTKIDFDINGPLGNLAKLRGKVVRPGEEADAQPEVSLLRQDAQDRCTVLPLDEAKAFMDYVWDHLFEYNYHEANRGG